MSDELAENAMVYTIVTGIWSGEYNEEIGAASDAYGEFMDLWYTPYIQPQVEKYGEYIFEFGIAVLACVNLIYTFATDSGLNNVAVLATMAKGVLRDQNLPGGYTLYGVLDIVVEKTAKGGVPPGEDVPVIGDVAAAATDAATA